MLLLFLSMPCLMHCTSILHRVGMLYPVGGAERRDWQTCLGARLCGPASILRSLRSVWYIYFVENISLLVLLCVVFLIPSTLRHCPFGLGCSSLPSPRFHGSQVAIADFLTVGQSTDVQLQVMSIAHLYVLSTLG